MRRLRHPVVLAHGLLGFTRVAVAGAKVASYFRGVAERFEEAGNRVFAPSVPATASVARRADALALAIRRDAGSERVHLIGHSMGGLDARHALTHLGLAGQVVSLTTLGAPHRGSPVADRITDLAGRAQVLERLALLGMDLDAARDLRRDVCAEFNDRTPDADGVRYLSFAGAKSRSATAVALRWAHDLVSAAEGPNDGLVSVASARWGSPSEVVEADHLDLVGWTPVASGPWGQPVDTAALWDRIADSLPE